MLMDRMNRRVRANANVAVVTGRRGQFRHFRGHRRRRGGCGITQHAVLSVVIRVVAIARVMVNGQYSRGEDQELT